MQRKDKSRLDTVLVEEGFFASRNQAQAAIMSGRVTVNGVKVSKPGTPAGGGDQISVLGEDMPYVSRGGLKLGKAIEVFNIDFNGKIVVDLGASTGGFTDCALQHGAAVVFAVDVGYGQLAWKLRTDSRVVNMERKNARYLSREDLGRDVDLVTVDVSFISLGKILPAAEPILVENGEVIALVKPQFEAGRGKVGKKGVVREPEIHGQVLEQVVLEAEALGLNAAGLTYSPVKGPEGNIEFLLYLKKGGEKKNRSFLDMEGIVKEAWQELYGK